MKLCAFERGALGASNDGTTIFFRHLEVAITSFEVEKLLFFWNFSKKNFKNFKKKIKIFTILELIHEFQFIFLFYFYNPNIFNTTFTYLLSLYSYDLNFSNLSCRSCESNKTRILEVSKLPDSHKLSDFFPPIGYFTFSKCLCSLG